jgi:hypothetical protein
LAVKINTGKFARIPAQYSEDLHRAIRWMLALDATKRPSVEDLEKIPNVRAVLKESCGPLMREYQLNQQYGQKARELKAKEDELARREQVLLERERAVAQREQAVAAKIAELQRSGGMGGGLPSVSSFASLTSPPPAASAMEMQQQQLQQQGFMMRWVPSMRAPEPIAPLSMMGGTASPPALGVQTPSAAAPDAEMMTENSAPAMPLQSQQGAFGGFGALRPSSANVMNVMPSVGPSMAQCGPQMQTDNQMYMNGGVAIPTQQQGAFGLQRPMSFRIAPTQ